MTMRALRQTARAPAARRRECQASLSTGNPCPRSATRPPSTARAARPMKWWARTSTSECRTSRADDVTLRTSALALVELDVPVEVVAPALRRVAQPNLIGDADRRRRVGPPRRPAAVHARLGRRAAALLPVAAHAAGDDVLPVLAAAVRHRHHVVEGQLRASGTPRRSTWHVWLSRA